MSSRKKSILIYLGGIITGIILTFAFFFFVALGNTNGTPSNNNVVILPDGSALATVEDISNIGMIVLFPADKEISYYDNQKIDVPSDKRVMQVGTYKYISRSEMEKTVPIVEIMDK